MERKGDRYAGDQFDAGLVEKFYRGECTEEEKQCVEEWFLGLEHRKYVNRRAGEEWENTPETGNQADLLQEILYKVHYALRLEEYKEGGKKKGVVMIKRIAAAVAVSVILAFTGFWFGRNNSSGIKNVYSELHAPYGSRIHFELPDGSCGWLNSGSSLRYPVVFTGRKRMVSLEGEGYFDVSSDHKRPFIVQTRYSRVVALGTSFDVQAYHGSMNEEITLVQGKVVIEKKQPDNSYRHLLALKSGQHVKIGVTASKVLDMSQETEKYVAWKDGKLVFRNDPLSRIVKEMERFYNVEIEVKDPELYKYHFHATFEDETLFEALRLLTISTPMTYKICKREKGENGIYRKRKVIIYKKV